VERGQRPLGKTVTVPAPSAEFWSGRRVLVTGHTGFKGTWLSCWLDRLGANVMGVSLQGSPTQPSLWDQVGPDIVDVRADIATNTWQARATAFEPQIVLHLAAQSLVLEGYLNPLDTFLTNVSGTARVMDLLGELNAAQAAVIVTTDKVYDTRQPAPFSEDSYLGGLDPYSASKACADLMTASWPKSHVAVGTARAGNVIGGGDWSADRLLPDLMRSWAAGEPAALRRPDSVRPWQHVLEPLRGYLLQAEALASGHNPPAALNFGPTESHAVTVGEVVAYAAEAWAATGQPRPVWTALTTPPIAETNRLELDSQLAFASLGWRNLIDWKRAIELTVEWYAEVDRGAAPRDMVAKQLAAYITELEESE
jgi:CDP-glucose 4,6-dehydratase